MTREYVHKAVKYIDSKVFFKGGERYSPASCTCHIQTYILYVAIYTVHRVIHTKTKELGVIPIY